MPDLLIKKAVQALQAQQIIAYPTEGVYGLGCDLGCEEAVTQLLALKQRPVEKGLILIASELAQVKPYIDLSRLAPDTWQRVQASWPGAVTWVLPATEQVPNWITGGRDTVAIRVSAHPTVQAIGALWQQPWVSTSANPSDALPAKDCAQCQTYFGKSIAVCIPAPLGDLQQPTEIYDALTGNQLR